MCLAIPMQIVQLEADGVGVAELDGVRHRVDLSLVGPVQPGDHVIIHAGYAIEKLDPAAAREQLALFQELAAAWKAAP